MSHRWYQCVPLHAVIELSYPTNWMTPIRTSSRRQSITSPTGQNMIVGWFSLVTFVSGSSRMSLMVGPHRYAKRPAARDGSRTSLSKRPCSWRPYPPRSPPKIIVPPQNQSIPPPSQPHSGTERECHAEEIAAHGRMAWQKHNDYGLRSLVETGVSRIKPFQRREAYRAQVRAPSLHICFGSQNGQSTHSKPKAAKGRKCPPRTALQSRVDESGAGPQPHCRSQDQTDRRRSWFRSPP